MLYLKPDSVGPHRFNLSVTEAKFSVIGCVLDYEVVTLDI